MTDLYLPEHARREIESGKEAEMLEMARQQMWAALAGAYRAGFELALKTPARLRNWVNLSENFGRWFTENYATEDEA